MNKLKIIGIATASLLVLYFLSAFHVSATLDNYFGGNAPDNEALTPLAIACGIEKYSGGTVDKLELLSCMRAEDVRIAKTYLPQEDDLGAGYNPITGYQSRTTGFISKTDTTIPVSTTKDPAGNQIELANISSSSTVKVYLNLAPGTSKEEPTVCTGVTATSWTNCTRGLAFQGSSETASTTLQQTHNAGTPIIITNIGQFFNQYVAIEGDQTINGDITFKNDSATTTILLGPDNNTYDKCIQNNNGDSDLPFICYDENGGTDGLGRWVISHDGTNSFVFPTSTDGVSVGGLGITIDGGVIDFDPAATSTSALGFAGEQAIVVIGTGLTIDSDGLNFNTTTDFTGNNSWAFNVSTTGQFSFDGLTFYNATTTFATTTIASSTITNLNVNGVSINQLVDGSEVEGLHTHKKEHNYLATSTITEISVIDTTTETTSTQFTVPANTLINHNALSGRITIDRLDLNANDTLTVRLYFGEQSISEVLTNSGANVIDKTGWIDFGLIAGTSTNYHAGYINGTIITPGTPDTTFAHLAEEGFVTTDGTVDQTFEVTFELSDGASSDQIITDVIYVNYHLQ